MHCESTPAGGLLESQSKGFPAAAHLDLGPLRNDLNRQPGPEVGFPTAARSRRAGEPRRHPIRCAVDRHAQSARHVGSGIRIGREDCECPLRPTQVGCAHRRQRKPKEWLWRVGDRNTKDRTENTVLTQKSPERLTLVEHADARTELSEPLPPGTVAGCRGLHRRELREIGSQVEIQEVEDLVLAGIHAGLKRRPRHRRDRRQRRLQILEGPFLRESPQTGQASLVAHPPLTPGIETIQADHHNLRDRASKAGGASLSPGQRQSEGQRQQRDNQQCNCGQHYEIRPEQTGARSGSDLGSQPNQRHGNLG